MKDSFAGLFRYVFAAAAVLAALLAALWLRDRTVGVPFFLFLAAVSLGAWRGGLGPGLLATALSALATDYFFLPPIGRLSLLARGEGIHPGLTLFLLGGAIISGIHGLRKRDRDRWRDRAERLGGALDNSGAAAADEGGRGTSLGRTSEGLAGPLPRVRNGRPAVVPDVARERARRDGTLRWMAAMQEDERRHLARELHDEAGQQLTTLILGLNSARLQAPSLEEPLARLQELAQQTASSLHRLACRLRPASLDALGLEAALRHRLEGWGGPGAPRVEMHSTLGGDEGLTAEAETHLYRIVCEALTNVARHAGARRASVILQRARGHLLAIVEDDGRGFDPDAAPAGRLGLGGMRERAALIGGSVQIESALGRGTTVLVRVPLPRRPGGER